MVNPDSCPLGTSETITAAHTGMCFILTILRKKKGAVNSLTSTLFIYLFVYIFILGYSNSNISKDTFQ